MEEMCKRLKLFKDFC